MQDSGGLLEGSGDRMRHIKLRGVEDIRDETFRELVRSAVELNRSLGNPKKRS